MSTYIYSVNSNQFEKYTRINRDRAYPTVIILIWYYIILVHFINLNSLVRIMHKILLFFPTWNYMTEHSDNMKCCKAINKNVQQKEKRNKTDTKSWIYAQETIL